VRFIIDIDEVNEKVEGRLRREDDNAERSFSGWLQLMGMLEPPNPSLQNPRPGKPRLEAT
jgi:hypothetical protein